MIKKAVSLVIYDSLKEKVLAVMRGSEDKYLPNTWSLPSGYVDEEESLESAVIRAASQKLGVEVRPVKVLGSGSVDRTGGTLQMTLYEVEIMLGTPMVPQPIPDVTQYDFCEMVLPKQLEDAAKKEVLSCVLYLKNIGYNF